jgi:hypothetical protein
MFDIPKQGEPLPEAKPEKPEKRPKPARVKRTCDPRLAAAARELRDRWLEQVNATPLVGQAKYEVSRAIEDQEARSASSPSVAGGVKVTCGPRACRASERWTVLSCLRRVTFSGSLADAANDSAAERFPLMTRRSRHRAPGEERTAGR